MGDPAARRSAMVLWCAAILFALGPVSAAAESISTDARAGLELCLKHFAEPRKGRQALEAAGWNFQGTENEYQWLTKNVARSVVALGRNTGRNPQGCFASYDGMTLEDATELAEAEATKRSFERVSVQEAAVGIVWKGKIGTVAVTINVLKPAKYDRHTGAAVILIVDE